MKGNAINKLKTILGYTAAVFAMVVVLATFMGNSYFSHKLVSATGIKVSPWYTGGEILKSIEHDTYTTHIHRPVFDGLIGKRQEGFIQINWEARTGMPPVILETMDYDGDSKADFLVTLDTATGETSITGYNPAVASIQKTYKLNNGWAVRIKLKKVS
jgi:hypothetical protein